MEDLEYYWTKKESKHSPPELLQNIKEINYNEWKSILKNHDRSRSIIDELYNGNILLIKKVIPVSILSRLKDKLNDIKVATPSSFHKIIENCPNFHKSIDDKIDTKYSIRSTRHSFYFFRWNTESNEIYKEVDQIWSDIKFLSGRKKESFINNTPKDGIVDRVQIVHYPVNTGYIEPHQHNALNQRLIISIYMSKQGIDYKDGGTYFVDKNKNKVNLEKNIDVGDVGIFYASMIHGVDSVNIYENQNPSESGRWWGGLYSPESDHVENRKTSNAADI